MNEETIPNLREVRPYLERKPYKALYQLCMSLLPKIYRAALWVARQAIKTACGFTCGFITSLWAISFAYDERGYSAAGGEMILIFAGIFFGILAADKLMK